jgi:hypothetical protein
VGSSPEGDLKRPKKGCYEERFVGVVASAALARMPLRRAKRIREAVHPHGGKKENRS